MTPNQVTDGNSEISTVARREHPMFDLSAFKIQWRSSRFQVSDRTKLASLDDRGVYWAFIVIALE
jgi:hypothetical protein